MLINVSRLLLLLFLSAFSIVDVSAGGCSLNYVSAKYSKSENSILFWQNRKGVLSEAQIAYTTDNYISNIAASVVLGEIPLIVWVESNDKGNRIMSAVKGADNKWLSPVVVASSKNELSSSSMISSTDGVAFLAWASDASGNDDIYYTEYRQGKWAAAKLVNPKNKVPDILPTLSISNDGSVALAWRSFNDPLIGYEDKFTSLTSVLGPEEMKEVLEGQCIYDRPEIKHPASDEPLFINYYQDPFYSFEKNVY